MRYFISNVDSYLGRILVAEIRQFSGIAKLEIYGTLTSDVNDANVRIPRGMDKIVSRQNMPDMLKIMTSCDKIFYDLHTADVDEVEIVIRYLKNFPSPIFILISSVLTWARTPTVKDSETNIQPAFTDEQWRKRIAPPAYQRFRSLESLALALPKSLVIATGCIYGKGDFGFFRELFESCFFGEYEKVAACLVNENAFLPTIHVSDLARAVNVLAVEAIPGNQRYLIAVDQGNHTHKEIVETALKMIANLPLSVLPAAKKGDLIAQNSWASVDLRFTASSIFSRPELKTRTLEGFLKCGDKVAAEFLRLRKLKPLKAAVIGPPCVGESTQAKMLSEKFRVTLLSVGEIVKKFLEKANEYAKQIAEEQKLKEEQQKAAEEAQNEENQATAEASAAAAPVEEAAPVQRTSLQELYLAVLEEISKSGKAARMSTSSLAKVIKLAIESDVIAKSRGFVLDGFPRNAEEAEEFLLVKRESVITKQIMKQNHEETEENPADAEFERIEETVVKIESDPLFNSLVIFLAQAPQQKLQERNSLNLQAFGKSSHYSTADFQRRLAKYDESALMAFLQKNSFSTCPLDFSPTANVVFDLICCELEKVGVSIASMERKGGFDDDPARVAARLAEQEKRALEEKEAAAAEIRAQELQAKNDQEAIQAEQVKKQAEQEKLAELTIREKEQLERQSRHLREFLDREILPVVAAGVLDICKEMPEDPIEYLAEYLLAKSEAIQKAKSLDPFKSNEISFKRSGTSVLNGDDAFSTYR
jgi:adenylate kinase